VRTTQVQGGVLATWDTTEYADGPWVIRLSVVTNSGPTLTHDLRLVPRN